MNKAFRLTNGTSSDILVRMDEIRHDVLCGCGWGKFGVPESEIPQFCPVCGFDFWEYAGR